MQQTTFCYKTGDYYIALEAGIRSELLPLDKIYPVPFAPDWCVGLVSSRGELFPVVDMHHVLLNQARPEQQYLMLLNHEAHAPIVVSCDGLPQQVDVPDAEQDEERIPGLPGWVKRTWVQNETVYLGADHGRLFRTLADNKMR